MSWARPSILGRRHVAAPIVLTVIGVLSAPVLAAQGGGGTAPVITGRTVVKRLADPAGSALGGVAALGSALSPDEELDAALVGLAGASDAAAVTRFRQRALDVLEGNPVAGRVWSGIPLLAVNGVGKVKTVPAGGSVTVTEVRFGERALSDTAALRFENPALPFSVVYRVAELGGTMGGLLTPVPLAVSGSASAVVRQLLSVPRLATGTTEVNRSHPAGAAEQTRLVVQDVTVAMPAPNAVAAVLDPSMRPGRPSFVSLLPASAERVAALESFGGDRAAAIGRLSDVAPAKQLWADLTRLGSSDVAAAHALGVADRALVAGVRSHLGLPAGVTAAGGDLTVALAGNEAFTSRNLVPLAPGAAATVMFRNLDLVPHTVSAVSLGGGTRAPFNWGSFNWHTINAGVTVAPRETVAMTLALPSDTFAVWLGDMNSGDQASVLVPAGPGAIAVSSQPAVPAPKIGPAPAPRVVTDAAAPAVTADATLAAAPPVVSASRGFRSLARVDAALDVAVKDAAASDLAPVVVAQNEPPKADDPLVKVKPKKASEIEDSADGGGSPRGYTGLYKLAGLVLFLAFAWGWWAWGGSLPSPRPDEA